MTITPLINWLLEKEIILESQIPRIKQVSDENFPFELSIACTTIDHLGSKFEALKAFVLQGIEPSPEILQELEYIGIIQNKKIPPFVQMYFDYFIKPLDNLVKRLK